MANANDPSDPATMTPDERLAEVSKGVLRLRQRQAGSAPDAPLIHSVESAESAGSGLDECAGTCPHGQRG